MKQNSDEKMGYRSTKPSYRESGVKIYKLKNEGIESVCCLLDDVSEKENELGKYYEFDLIKKYQNAFGASDVFHKTIGDYNKISVKKMNYIINFINGKIDE